MIIIIFVSALTGEIISESLKRRVGVLRQTDRFLETAEIFISSKAMTYEDIVFEACDDDKFSELVFLLKIKEAVLDGETNMRMLWEKSVKDFNPYYLKKEDTQILSDIGNTLGAYDTENEIKSLDGIKKLLSLNLNEAEKEYTEKGKIYRILGVMGGLLAAIVFI